MTPPFFVGPGSVGRNVEMIQWAESVGYDDVWLADSGGIDALTLAGLVLDRTQRIRVGIAVVPAYTRTPAVFAATAATLSDVAPGRFALGLGTSSQAMIEGWHGMTLDRPVVRMRETVELLRAMLAGEKTAFEGQTLRSNGYRQPPIAGDVPILLAALGPRMVELATEVADGVILNMVPVSALERLLSQVEDGIDRAGRDRADVEVCSRFQVMVTDDPAAARDAFRFRFTPYFANPVYNDFLASNGFAAEAAALNAARTKGDWKAARAALTDELVDEIAVIGTREHCHQRVSSVIEAGVTTPMLFCLSEDPDIQRHTYAAFTPEQFDGTAWQVRGGEL